MTAVQPTEEQITATLKTALTEVLEPADLAHVDLDAVGPHTPLLSLPLDSITLVSAMSRIETEYRVFIPEQKAFAFKTVADLAEFVQERVQAKAARTAQ
ncbi:acyl carrier protein [Streptomyces sp. NPDC048411]|uniref:acyl carrier protein n=1 Tax=Streptomyces sp. NPDC048411 TaxID=3157206 RepID=UPI003451B36D